jgi:uncharacterized protein (DUF2384 family)
VRPDRQRHAPQTKFGWLASPMSGVSRIRATARGPATCGTSPMRNRRRPVVTGARLRFFSTYSDTRTPASLFGRSKIPIVTKALSEVLGRPMTPKDTLGVLREVVGLSDRELARALQVTDRSVKRWRAGAAISTEGEERVHDLARVIAQLVSVGVPDRNVRAWFLYRNHFLGEERPIDVFAAEGFSAVQPAVAALRDGYYA